MRYVTYDEKKQSFEVATRDGFTPACVKCSKNAQITTSGGATAAKDELIARDGKVLCPAGGITPIPSTSFASFSDVLTTSEVNMVDIPAPLNPANVRNLSDRHYSEPKYGTAVEYVGVIDSFGLCRDTPEYLADKLSKVYGEVYDAVLAQAKLGNDNSFVAQKEAIDGVLSLYSLEDRILIASVINETARNAARDAYKNLFPVRFGSAYTAALDTGENLLNADTASFTQIITAMREQALLADVNYINNAALHKTLLFAADDAYITLKDKFVSSLDAGTENVVFDDVATATATGVTALNNSLASTFPNAQADNVFGGEWAVTTEKFFYEPKPSVLEFSAYADTPMSGGLALSGSALLLSAQVTANVAILRDTINYRYRI